MRRGTSPPAYGGPGPGGRKTGPNSEGVCGTPGSPGRGPSSRNRARDRTFSREIRFTPHEARGPEAWKAVHPRSSALAGPLGHPREIPARCRACPPRSTSREDESPIPGERGPARPRRRPRAGADDAARGSRGSRGAPSFGADPAIPVRASSDGRASRGRETSRVHPRPMETGRRRLTRSRRRLREQVASRPPRLREGISRTRRGMGPERL